MLKHLRFWIVIITLLQTSQIEAQVNWNKIIVPDTISGFSIGSDGSLYISTKHDLYFSGDCGNLWTKIYSEDIGFLACDSNSAVVIGNDSGILYSLDRGTNWIELSKYPYDISYRGGIECTGKAIYFIPGYNNTLYRNVNYDSTWSSMTLSSGEIDDLTGPYCGTPDRVFVGLHFESGWVLLDSLSIESDTMCDIRGSFADNSPPSLITFGKDGYLYMWYSGFMRLPSGSHQWDCYDPWDTSWYRRIHHFPYSSVSSKILISVDTGGTWTSNDHGTSWTRIGNPPPMSWSLQLDFDSKGHGYAYTDSGIFETDFFAEVKQRPANSFELALSPNPCGPTLEIKGENISKLEIMDALGRIRMQYPFTHSQDNPEVDVETLPPGTYYLLAEINELRKITAFIKQ